jgi:predicted NUDIX family NTP pyrophosphohydrolase
MLPVRRVELVPGSSLDPGAWPATVPAVARLPQLDRDGWHERDWPELELVQHYRRFLDEPMRYLRHVLDPADADHQPRA